MRLSLRWVVAVAILGVVATCNETPVTLPQPSTVAVVPSSLSMFAGEAAGVAAQVLDQDGQVLESAVPDWSSSNTAVARVSPTGTVTAVTAGTATLTAAYGNISSTVAVTVANAARVDVTPGSVQLLPAATQSVTAVVLGPGGEPLTALVTWRSLNPGIATVGSSGATQNIVGLVRGSTSVIAEAAGRADTVPVAVVQDSSRLVASVAVTPGSVQLLPNATQSVTAVTLSARGEPLTTLVTWRSLDPGIATVGSSGETQYIAGHAQGNTSVIAEVSGRADTVPVAVVQDSSRLVASVAVTPGSVQLVPNATQSVTAVTLSARGERLTTTLVTWRSLNPGIATVGSSGETQYIAGQAQGSTSVIAEVSGRADTVPVAVVQDSSRLVASVAVTPGSVQLLPNATQSVTAVTLSARGERLTTTLVTWRSLDPGIATVGSSGETQYIAGLVQGNTSVIAEVSGRADTVPVAVVPDSSMLVASVAVTPGSVQLYTTAQQSVTAVVLNARGERIAAPFVTWRSLNPGIATVGSSGATQYIEGQAQGTTTVIAEVSGSADTVPIPVVVVADARELITSIRILPDTQPYTEVTVDGASLAPLEIEYRMQDGYGMERCVDYDHFELAFRFNRSVIDSVSQVQNGSCRLLITPVGQPGSSWLHASINTVTDSLLVTINRIGYRARFSVLPADSTIMAGETVQYTVEVLNEANVPAAGVAVNFDVDGGALSDRSVTTGALGTAVVSWILPSRAASGLPIPPDGTDRWISFQLEHPSGDTLGPIADTVSLLPNVATRLVLLGNFGVGASSAPPSPAVDTLGATVNINLAVQTDAFVNMNLYAQSFDRFGNPRITAAVFRATDASIISQPGQISTSGNSSQAKVHLNADRLRTETVTATEGTASATLDVTWNVGPRIVFQETGSSVVLTGQPYPRTTATGLLGDTTVYDGLSGAASYPTFTLRSDTLAFLWDNTGWDVGLVASNGDNRDSPVSAIPAEYRSSSVWGFPAFVSGVDPAGVVLFLSNGDPAKNVTSSTGWLSAFHSASDSGYTRTFTGLGTVSANGVTATFTSAQANMVVGSIVTVLGIRYTVATKATNFSFTLSGLPTFAASPFIWSRADGSFVTDGFTVGAGITVSGISTLDNGPSVITRVTRDTLYVTKTGIMENVSVTGGAAIAGVHVWDLYRRTRVSNTTTKVTNTAVLNDTLVLRGISLSPDGTKALLTSEASGARRSQVYEVTLATGALTAVTANTDASTNYAYAGYSPDGTKIYMDRTSHARRELVEWSASTGFRVLQTGLAAAVAAMPSFDPTDPTRFGFLNAVTGELTFFTVPSGSNTLARLGLSYFSWSRR